MLCTLKLLKRLLLLWLLQRFLWIGLLGLKRCDAPGILSLRVRLLLLLLQLGYATGRDSLPLRQSLQPSITSGDWPVHLTRCTNGPMRQLINLVAAAAAGGGGVEQTTDD